MKRETSAFEQRVYEALCRVPAGKVVTYKILAKAVSCGSAQAIGNAMRRNPYAPKVPCHRVLPSTLKIGGYEGAVEGEKVARKLELLASEGVTFNAEGKLSDTSRVLNVID